MIMSTIRTILCRRAGIGGALLALAVMVSACDQASSSASSAAPKSSPSQAGFNLGGVYRVDLHYGNFKPGPECPPGSAQPFDVSYRASAEGANVTLKNLGQGFDMTGTGQRDGTLSLSGGMDLGPVARQSGTLKGRWSPPQLDFEAGIRLEITPQQGPKTICNVVARATGTATKTT
jgi:hypothetical protein